MLKYTLIDDSNYVAGYTDYLNEVDFLIPRQVLFSILVRERHIRKHRRRKLQTSL